MIDKTEQWYIRLFNTRNPNGYNLSVGGDAERGFRWPLDSRLKFGVKMRGNTRCVGKQHSNESKAQCSRALLGHAVSEETRAKIREARARQIVRKGYKWSDESRARLSQALKGKRNSIATEFVSGQVPWNKGLRKNA